MIATANDTDCNTSTIHSELADLLAKALSLRDAGKVLLTPKEAAEALSVCERTLWGMTGEREGQIRCVRVGRLIRYRPETLFEWAAQRETGSEPAENDRGKLAS